MLALEQAGRFDMMAVVAADGKRSDGTAARHAARGCKRRDLRPYYGNFVTNDEVRAEGGFMDAGQERNRCPAVTAHAGAAILRR